MVVTFAIAGLFLLKEYVKATNISNGKKRVAFNGGFAIAIAFVITMLALPLH
jgi:hypothetical protein